MPVTEQNTSNSYTGNGVTTVFAYSFLLLNQSEVSVTVGGVLKTITTDYTVSGVGAPGGGNITFVSAPANLSAVVIQRSMPYARATDYQENGDLLAAVLDEDNDRQTMLIQQVRDIAKRAIKLPAGVTVDQILPTGSTAAERADRVIGFDSAGNPTLHAPVDNTLLAVDLASTASGKGAALVGFISAGAGSAPRTVLAKQRETPSATDFYANGASGIAVDPTGVTLSSAGINAALAAHAGGKVILPAGTFLVNDITVPANTTLEGAGIGETILVHNTGVTTGVVILQGPNSKVTHLTINGNYPTINSGTRPGIICNANTWVDRVEVKNCFYISISAGASYTRITNNIITGLNHSTIGSYGIWAINNASVGTVIDGNTITNTLIDAIGVAGIGARVTNNHVSGCQTNTAIGGGQIAVYPGVAAGPLTLVANNYIGAGGNPTTTSGMELNGWTYAVNNVVELQGNAGIVLQAGSRNIIKNNVVRNNLYGIFVDANLSYFDIVNNVCFDDQTVKTQLYGIYISAGTCTNYTIIGNNLTGNATGGLFNAPATHTAKKIKDNLGFSYAATQTIGASPWTYQNKNGEPVLGLIYGGTVSSVTVNGRQVATATNCQIVVEDTGTVVITYSALPAMDVYGLTGNV